MRASAASAIVAALGFGSLPAHAANSAFQSFFFDVCASPTGALAARCAETTGAAGDLSGDSESSLNPSQPLSGADGALAGARNRSKEADDRVARLQSGEAAPTGNRVDIGPFSLLLNARMRFDESDRTVDRDAERGYDADAWGVELGFDYRVSDQAVIGAIVSTETVDTEFDRENAGVNFAPAAHAGEIEQDSLGITVFGSFDLNERAYVQGSAGYTASDYEFNRNSVFQESNRAVPQTDVRVRADTDGTEWWVSMTSGYVIEQGGWSYTPYAGLVYAKATVDGYRETDLNGSGLAMAIDEVDRSSLTGRLGLQVSGGIATRAGVLLPHVRIEYEHEFDRDAATSDARYLLDGSQAIYRFEGDDRDGDLFNAGIGVTAVLRNGWIPFLDYEILLGSDFLDSYRITAGLRKEL